MLAHSEFRLLFRDTPNESIHHWISRSFRLSEQPFYPGPYLQMAADHTNNATHLLWTSSFNGFPVQIGSRTYFIQWWQKLPLAPKYKTHPKSPTHWFFGRCIALSKHSWGVEEVSPTSSQPGCPAILTHVCCKCSFIKHKRFGKRKKTKNKSWSFIIFFLSPLGSERAFQHVLKTFCHICSLSFLCSAWLSSSTLLFFFSSSLFCFFVTPQLYRKSKNVMSS